jgi:hypothetical protein
MTFKRVFCLIIQQVPQGVVCIIVIPIHRTGTQYATSYYRGVDVSYKSCYSALNSLSF